MHRLHKNTGSQGGLRNRFLKNSDSKGEKTISGVLAGEWYIIYE